MTDGSAAWAQDFERRARATLGFDLPDGVFATGMDLPAGDSRRGGGLTAADRPRLAAVLMAVVTHSGVPTLILTRRTGALRDHAGQIALPGGKVDRSDESPCAAALREAEEEIGLQPGRVTPLGYLDPYLTGTGFLVVPTVATVAPPLKLTLNPREVDEAFEVPLPFLMDAANHQRHARVFDGRERRFYAMPFENRFIWGITAGILRALYERLYG